MTKLIFFVLLLLLSLACVAFSVIVWIAYNAAQRQGLLVVLLLIGLVLMLISTQKVAYLMLYKAIPYQQAALHKAHANKEVLYHWKLSSQEWEGLIHQTRQSNRLAMVLLLCLPLLLYLIKMLLVFIFKMNMSTWGIEAILALISIVSVWLAIFLYFHNLQSIKLYQQSPKEVVITKDTFWIGHQMYSYDTSGYKVKQAVLKEEGDFLFIKVFLKAADYDNVAYMPFPKDKKEEAQKWINSLLGN